MNGSAPPVTFDYETWVTMYPEFSALSSSQGQGYFYRATGICANSCTNPIFATGNLEWLLYTLTSHFAWLSSPKGPNGNPIAGTAGGVAGGMVGRISSASEGSVSVSTELDLAGNSSALDAFLSQTSYGLEYLAKIAQYRNAQYLARPTRVLPGLRYPYFGGFGRW